METIFKYRWWSLRVVSLHFFSLFFYTPTLTKQVPCWWDGSCGGEKGRRSQRKILDDAIFVTIITPVHFHLAWYLYLQPLNIKSFYRTDNCKLVLLLQKQLWKIVIRKYPTTHNHPQPPTNTQNYPQPSTTSHNQPQPLKKPPTTTQKTIHNHPQPSTTTQKLPKKAKTCHKQLYVTAL